MDVSNTSRRRPAVVSSLAVIALCATMPALAVDLKTPDGGWTFSIDGNVNVDYIYTSCDANPKPIVDVGGACGATASGRSSSNVSNGLLPAAFSFGVATTQAGIDLAAHLGVYPGISTNDGGSPNLQSSGPNNVGLGTTGLDVRQVYMTFGNASMGTFTLGRNFGLFGFDAIINDMTLLGVGVGGAMSSANPANTSLGSIGYGYIYTDTLAQMDWTSPVYNGATVTIGIFDPVNSLTEPGTAAAKTAPGVHAKVAWKGVVDGMKVSLSATGIEQQQKYDLTTTTSGHYQSTGADVFGMIDIGSLTLTASGYYGRGMGITGLYFLSDDGLGHARDSYGYLLQATYTIEKLKLGVNYGVSRLAFANEADRAATPTLVSENDKVTGGAYYSLTRNLTLLGEVSWAQSNAHTDSSLNSNSSIGGNFGAYLAF
jgi:predicted porin